jgi:ribosomal protein S18 acetylase RimI-like enzyme
MQMIMAMPVCAGLVNAALAKSFLCYYQLMNICCATFSDAPNLVRLAHEAYRHYIGRIGRPPAPMLADFNRHIIDDTVFIAINGVICGYVVLCYDAGCWRLDNIAVAPSSQGQGIGAALIRHSESLMAKRGGISYQLYTNELMHENINWYQNTGFCEIARREDHGFKRVYFEKTIHQP